MIAIIKYPAGNITSVENAVNRLGYQCVVTDDVELLKSADKVIFPGVGEASTAMKSLKETGLDKIIPALTQPVLGICLGQQLMCNFSEENNTECLGIFNTTVKKFPPTELVPHMGWNDLKVEQSRLLEGVSAEDNFYFVHSFYAEVCESTTATCDYILPFSAVMEKDNFYATQFHPEKSADAGERILKNFLEF